MSTIQLPDEHTSRQKTRCMKTSLLRGREVVNTTQTPKSNRVPWLRSISPSCPLLGCCSICRHFGLKSVNQMSNVQLSADHISHLTSQLLKTSIFRGREVVNKHTHPDNKTGYHGCDSFASSWAFLRCVECRRCRGENKMKNTSNVHLPVQTNSDETSGRLESTLSLRGRYVVHRRINPGY